MTQISTVGSERSLPPATMLDVALRHLKAEGVVRIFGIPGGLLHPFFDAVESDAELQLVVAKHECGAAFMADGYARTTGQLAVVAATSGPGATNLITGVSCAFSDGVPMLVITGQAPSQSLGKGAAQETASEDIDIVGMFRPVTKYSARVDAPERFSHHLRRALRLALSGRPGPAHLNVPVDFWSQSGLSRYEHPQGYRPNTHAFDRSQVQDAAAALLAAERPVVLLGAGATSQASQAGARALAEQLGARVATTPRAKGAFPEDHPLSLGVLGFAGHKDARETLLDGRDGVDLLLTIGASLNETTTLNWHPGLTRNRTFVQLDIDVDRIGRNYPVDLPLVGDAEAIVVELRYHIARAAQAGATIASTWGAAPPLASSHIRFGATQPQQASTSEMSPQAWRSELNRILPADAILFSDIGGHMLFNLRHLQIRQGQQFVLNLGFGSMGHGTAAPIGAALGNPQRPVLAIIGDACFMMQGMELLTAVEYNVPVVWLVENNEMHGITWHGSKLVNGGRAMGSIVYRSPPRISDIAQAMGLGVSQVRREGELTQALAQALAQRKPWLIELQVDPTISPPLGDRAKTVAGFKN